MKSNVLIFIFLHLVLLGCKSSTISKQNLIVENKVLKERIKQLENVDTANLNAVVEVSSMNVVYRGITNPMRIAIPNAVRIEATAPGLKKIDEFGNYNFIPRSGNHVDINILGIMPNNDTIHVTKKIRIKNIGRFFGTINGIGCGAKCEVLLTKRQLKNGTLKAKLNDFLFDWADKTEITSFKIKIPKHKTIDISGHKIKGLDEQIQHLTIGDIVQIFDIKLKITGQGFMKPPSPIIIRIVED